MKCHVGHTRPPTRALWSTFGPHAIGVERFATVSSGRSFAQVAGAILRKQAHGQNPPGSSGDHADHPHVRDQFGRPRATSTPHNWHNFLRCHEQAAECRHPAVMARSKPLRDELGPPRFRSREPHERILATPPAHRRETIGGPIWTSPRSSRCGCAGRSSSPSGDPPSTSGCG
jgi:hypothetical protein